MAIITLSAIVAGIGGAVSWFATLPNQFKGNKKKKTIPRVDTSERTKITAINRI